MSRKLLISDANIIIDIMAGDLVDAMFRLEYDFATPDILFEQELKDQHPEIVTAGLQVLELEPETVAYASTIYQADTDERVSLLDCMALALARQEQTVLLTGDARLRQRAEAEHLEVKGTLWLVQQMHESGLINADQAEAAYNSMINDGSRLPVNEINRQLRAFRRSEQQ